MSQVALAPSETDTEIVVGLSDRNGNFVARTLLFRLAVGWRARQVRGFVQPNGNSWDIAGAGKNRFPPDSLRTHQVQQRTADGEREQIIENIENDEPAHLSPDFSFIRRADVQQQ